MRKSLLALACLFLTTAPALAVEVTLLNFDPEQKLVIVQEGEEQKTYKITDATKFYGVADGPPREMTYADAVKGLGNEKSPGNLRFNVEVKDNEISEAKFKARKQK